MNGSFRKLPRHSGRVRTTRDRKKSRERGGKEGEKGEEGERKEGGEKGKTYISTQDIFSGRRRRGDRGSFME